MCYPMAINRLTTNTGRCAAAWLAVAVLMAAEHHGTVKSAGLPLPGVTVTATQGEKKHTTTTDENGRYAFPELADGVWKLEIEMLGFEKLTNEVGVAHNAPSPDWSLKMASMSAITAPKPAEAPVSTPAAAAVAPATATTTATPPPTKAPPAKAPDT